MKSAESFDLVVVGGGPGGHAAAIQGAKLGARVALVERGRELGGRSVFLGALPSKTFRELTLALDGYRLRSGRGRVEMPEGTRVDALLGRLDPVRERHHDVVRGQLSRNRVTIVSGRGCFEGLHHLRVQSVTGQSRLLEAPFFVLATGCRPRHLDVLPVDHEYVLDSDSIFSLSHVPDRLAVVGAGALGCEFASVFASIGVEVTLIDRRERPLEFMDPDLTDRFEDDFRRRGGRYLPRSRLVGLGQDGPELELRLEEGTSVRVDRVVSAVGRQGNLGELDAAGVGVDISPEGYVRVDPQLRSSVEHIYAVGDINGPPFTASLATEQGRRAVCHALVHEDAPAMSLVPRGVYTIPEMASVGLRESEAPSGAVVGLSSFEELARGSVSGVSEGMLKLVVSPEGRVLGVHIIGEGATELIHVGQMALATEARVEVFVEHAMVYPSFAEAYRVAALDALSQLDPS